MQIATKSFPICPTNRKSSGDPGDVELTNPNAHTTLLLVAGPSAPLVRLALQISV